MKRWIAFLLVFALPSMGGSLMIAHEPVPAGGESIEARMARLLKELDDNRFPIRQRAEQELADLGEPAVKPLKKLLAAKPPLELVVRIQRILDKLAMYDEAGPLVNGLKVRLTADRSEVRVGDTVTFSTTVWNMTDRDLNLDFGPSRYGQPFCVGSAFGRVIVDVEGKPGVMRADNISLRLMSCGPSGISLTTLPAKSGKSFQAQATLLNEPPETTGYKRGLGFYFGVNPSFHLRVPSNGKHRIRVDHQVQEYQKKTWDTDGWARLVKEREHRELFRFDLDQPLDHGEPRNINAHFWVGSLESNEVEIMIRE